MNGIVPGTLVHTGDQNSLWDASIKIAALQRMGLLVQHQIHTADLFSRPPKDAPNRAIVTPEAYAIDGNVTRWTASCESAMFLGRMPMPLTAFTERGVNISALGRPDDRTLAERIELLTAGDWLGLSLPDGERAAHGVEVREILDTLPQLARPLRRNIAEAVGKGALASFDQLYNLGYYLHDLWYPAMVSVLRKALTELGATLDHGIMITSSVHEFSPSRKESLPVLLEMFTRDYDAAAECYNTAAAHTRGEQIHPLSSGELPFYAVVRQRGRGVIRVELAYENGDTPETILRRTAGGNGEILAICGKALVHLIEVTARGPLVMPVYGSAYSRQAYHLAELLDGALGFTRPLHPIYRLHLNALDALEGIETMVTLPKYLQKSFGDERVPASYIAERWREVATTAHARCEEMRGPIEQAIPALRSLGIIPPRFDELFSAALQHRNDFSGARRFAYENVNANEDGIAPAEKQRRSRKAHEEVERLGEIFGASMLEETYRGMLLSLESRRVQELRREWQIWHSLEYWNARPFVHWVTGVPGWFDRIMKHASLIPDPLSE